MATQVYLLMAGMPKVKAAISRVLLPLVTIAMPLVLLWSSLRTFNELENQRTAYLRNRTAAVAGRLETLPPSVPDSSVFEAAGQEEPALVDLELLVRGQAAAEQPFLTPLWEGRELFITETLNDGRMRLYRAYVPFHSSAGLRIARIDLDASAADFLVTHARHNVIAASVGGLALVLLSLYAVWATRRAARLEVRQLELQHLAHVGEMAAVLAHEIRNPLGTIKGFAQLAGEQTGEGVRELLEPILSETERLENLVNGLLLYGRPPVPAPRLAKWEETLIPLEAHASQLVRNGSIRFLADHPRLQWETDPHLLHQALLNLIRNAFEAVGDRPGGEVRLEVRRPDSGGVTLAVVDNGPGIPEQVRPNLFKPFFTTKPFGTGLGLSTTRALARSLGGEFTLSDSTPAGTEAVLSFPNAHPREIGPA
jgi:two-component system, NtrC family, sensor histidine kinase HydH